MAVIRSLEFGLPGRRTVLSALEIDTARANNQFLLTGASPSFLRTPEEGENYIAFIEYIEGTNYTISSNETTPKVLIPSRSTALFFDKAALRIDGGFIAAGTAMLIKGFWVKVLRS